MGVSWDMSWEKAQVFQTLNISISHQYELNETNENSYDL